MDTELLIYIQENNFWNLKKKKNGSQLQNGLN